MIDSIKVKLSKNFNAEYYNKPINSIIEIPLKEYLAGVVAAEIGSRFLESCKAQAVAARTVAYPYYSRNKIISDSHNQAFNAYRAYDEKYELARQAVRETEDEILYFDNKIIDTCAYSSSNGGKTTSSEARWGGYRAYLIEQPDPWDFAVTYGNKRGHGVGMSQMGAVRAASIGKNYIEILHFYYPGTAICADNQLDADGSLTIAKSNDVKASDLIAGFKKMLKEKWKYVPGAAETGKVDCSGAFSYWYKQLGSHMFHGSNTMWRNYSPEKNCIKDIHIVPGMAVYKVREWRQNYVTNKWYNTQPGDVYHVGLYVGDNKVIEAKGTKYGVVQTKLSDWTHASKLVNTTYDVEETDGDSMEDKNCSTISPCKGTVNLNSGYLNLREGPGRDFASFAKLYDGDVVDIIDKTDDWYAINYKGKIGYAASKYISINKGDPLYEICVTVKGDSNKGKTIEILKSMGLNPVVTSL